jgi:hypothetical protein
MLGRRSHERFTLTLSVEGMLRILRDVIVQRSTNNEWIAISREPGVTGETLVLDLGSAEVPVRFTVRVLESRPVVVDGRVRHRLRLDQVRWTDDGVSDDGIARD